jgi:hypothetical protein
MLFQSQLETDGLPMIQTNRQADWPTVFRMALADVRSMVWMVSSPNLGLEGPLVVKNTPPALGTVCRMPLQSQLETEATREPFPVVGSSMLPFEFWSVPSPNLGLEIVGLRNLLL